MFAKLIAFVGDNAIQIDAETGEANLRKECPELMLEDERVVFAFKDRGGAGRDDSYFTSQRILIRDVKGMTGKMVKYLSIPYGSIKAFSVESAGGALDNDCTLRILSSGLGSTSMDFVKGVDIFALARHLNEMVLVDGGTGAHVAGGAVATEAVPEAGGEGRVGGFLDWLGDDASQIDAGRVEAQLRRDPQLLVDDERVEMAFKCGRDSFLFTSKRILHIDVKGLSGSRVCYLTVLWKCLRAFSVETAGSFLDRDSEMTLFTNIASMPRIRQDFRKGRCDLMAVQRFIADKLLGSDDAPPSEHAAPMAGHHDAGSESLLAWMGDDSRMVDAAALDRQYHASPPILQGSEHVEMAFKGRRDLTLFTTKRLLVVDVKGWSGRKVNYVSVPWATVQAFGVRSAGAWLDKDSEMFIWTDINDVKHGDEPDPRNAFIEMDFQKDKVDLMAVHRYLSARCLRLAEGGYLPPEVPVAPEVLQAAPAGSVERFLNWVGDDARALDAGEVDRQLHSENPMLQEDERAVMAFKSGRDMLVLTTKRALLVDVQGWSGKKVEYKSVPYTSLRAFSVESAGSWDRDAEVKLFCKTYWADGQPGSVLKQDLRKGRVDIIAMQSFLAAQVIGADDGSATSAGQGPTAGAAGGLDAFLSWISDDAHEINPEEVTRLLRTSPPILQSDESVDLCFKVGRDMCAFTAKRLLWVDVQGWSGKKVEYVSYPLKYCAGFYVKSAGAIGFIDSATVSLYTDVPARPKVKRDLSHSKANIWSIQTMLSKNLLGRR